MCCLLFSFFSILLILFSSFRNTFLTDSLLLISMLAHSEWHFLVNWWFKLHYYSALNCYRMPVRHYDFFQSSCAELQVDMKQLTLLFTELYNALLPTVLCHSLHFMYLHKSWPLWWILLSNIDKNHLYRSKILTMISTTFWQQRGQANLQY